MEGRSEPQDGGTVITFYSYKGGTGRSMALANVAWILASNGQRVLVIDWDLEAPGLHRFFAPFLADPTLAKTEGLIDFLVNFATEAATPREAEPGGDGQSGWFEPLANILPYAASLTYLFSTRGTIFPKPGTIDFVPAGRQGTGYAHRVGAFDWDNFYERMGGGVFLEAAKRQMRASYDYILIDSRTGVSDTSGICTVQMPDVLVACFTANNQAIEGTAAIAASVRAQSSDGPPRRGPARILPVLTRVDPFEKTRLGRRQEYARDQFSKLLSEFVPLLKDRSKYWEEMQVPYIPFYCYEETLAPFGDQPRKVGDLLSSMERLTAYITEGAIRQMGELPDDATCQRILALYEGWDVPDDPESLLTNRPDLKPFYDSLMELFGAWRSDRGNSGLLIPLSVYNQLQDEPRLLAAVLESANFRQYWEESESSIQRQERLARLVQSLGRLNRLQLEKVISLFDVSRKYLPAMSSPAGVVAEEVVQLAEQRGEEGIQNLEKILQSTRLLSSKNVEQLILQACLPSPDGISGFVNDADVARMTRLGLEDVRYYLLSLEEEGLVTLVRLTDGFKAQITPQGRLSLSEVHRPLSSLSYRMVVPKGLRSFDEHDADFFLELIPGPRRADGLPESIHFWKTRIEETDPEKTFAVGVIFGPSGCGKSSLVKAGLLPRLSESVLSVFLEATADDTEARLLKGLRKHFPDLPADLDLRETLSAIRARKRKGSSSTRKALLILDQFEQWLLAHRTEQGTELAQALRQCDGEHVQCVLIVRDDFWMALTRFMSELGIEFHPGQNAAPVDLFDLIHARKVLAAFGRSYGRLPDDPESLSRDQEMFLNQAINGLAQDGRVISIRLTLFAEMVKGKPWCPATLKEVGGTEGVGVVFLEETFASAALRSHERAAQAVLKALLPESGSNIRGHIRSHEELLEASGYADRPKNFSGLLRVLDSELRLITPGEPEGSGDERPAGEGGGRYYQLTHDYLVPSLREWLARKQRETRRGRAELLLSDRSSLWNAKPENRHLPSLLEWANIRLFTRKRDWTAPQRTMMKRSGWVHGSRTLVALILLGLLTWGGIEGYGTLRGSYLVESLRTASTTDVPGIVRQLDGYRRWANHQLQPLTRIADDSSRDKLNASLALLPVDSSQLPFLEKHLLVASPTELPVIRDALKLHRSTLVPKLWSVLDSVKPDDVSVLRAASALADYDATSSRWESVGGKVAQALVSVNPVYLGPWLDALRPVQGKLNSPLAVIFRDKNCPETERTLATNILTDYASDEPNLIANLLMDADPKAYAAFFPIVERQQEKTLPLFQAEISKKPTYSWNDASLDPSWTSPDATFTDKIESAHGMLTERFAFCQTMPMDDFFTTAERLRKSGYRAIRFRPYADGKTIRVAAVWTRDGRPWRLVHNQSRDEIREADERNRKENFIPVDVAGYQGTASDGKPTDRFSALWVEKSGPEDEARMYVGVTSEDHKSTEDRLKKVKLIPRTLHAMRGTDGRTRYSGVWGRFSAVEPSWQLYWDQSEVSFRQNQVLQSDKLLIDVAVSGAEPLRSTRERAKTALEAAEKGLKLKPDDPNTQFGRATAYFQLGEDRKALDDLRVLIEKAPQFVNFYRDSSLISTGNEVTASRFGLES